MSKMKIKKARINGQTIIELTFLSLNILLVIGKAAHGSA
jgi:hypothetical protein